MMSFASASTTSSIGCQRPSPRNTDRHASAFSFGDHGPGVPRGRFRFARRIASTRRAPGSAIKGSAGRASQPAPQLCCVTPQETPRRFRKRKTIGTCLFRFCPAIHTAHHPASPRSATTPRQYIGPRVAQAAYRVRSAPFPNTMVFPEIATPRSRSIGRLYARLRICS